MKKKFLLTAILLTTFFFSNKLNAQTTLEEYNYLTKGYKVQIESGLDMKKGYEIELYDGADTGIRSVKLMILNRLKGQVKEKAAFLIIYTREGLPPEYICVPNPYSDEEIMNKYWLQLFDGEGNSSERLQLICYLLSKRLQW